MIEAWAPLCMEAAEWAHWQRSRHTSDRNSRPCDDCPLGFAAEMRSVGKCNGVPMGADEDEGEPMEPARIVTGGKEVPVAATTPCGSCAHAVVCRIKPVMEARIESLPVQMPVLDPAIRLTLYATVECAQFMRVKAAKPNPASADNGRGRYVRTPEHIAKLTAANRLRAEQKRAEREAAAS